MNDAFSCWESNVLLMLVEWAESFFSLYLDNFFACMLVCTRIYMLQAGELKPDFPNPRPESFALTR